VEGLDAELAAPRSFRRFLDGRLEAVHVVAAVAVVAEQQLKKLLLLLLSYSIEIIHLEVE
jgi:hypothetical protein